MHKGKNVVHNYIQRRVFEPTLIMKIPSPLLEIILVVPSYKEKLSDLLALCCSLENQTIHGLFELIIVLNNPKSDKSGYETNKELLNRKEEFQKFSFPVYIIDKTNLPDSKKVGVGLARKIGLDEGLQRFNYLNKNGLLVCLDADCTVEPTYISEIRNYFKLNISQDALSIGFLHPLDRMENVKERHAIIEYELHLRYYIHIQGLIGLPFAFQTVGSAMAVRSQAYAAEGGMPALKAGEDFYFLHKFIRKNKCGNLRKALVIPSGRISDRVPFGTGRAVGEIINSKKQYQTYQPTSFKILKEDLSQIINAYPDFKNIYGSLNKKSSQYFKDNDLVLSLKECLNNTKDIESFIKRFYQWFDAFRLMKYLHYLRDRHFPNVLVLNAVNELQEMKGKIGFDNTLDALMYYRRLNYD